MWRMRMRRRIAPRLGGLLAASALLLAACGSAGPGHPATSATTPAASSPASGVTATAGAARPTASPSPGAPGHTAAAPVRTTPAPVRTTPAPVRTTPAAPAVAAAGVPHLSHVVVILMENEEYGSIIGNSEAPYMNSLANQGALATRYYAVTHPSLPNYLALTGGSTFGISSDCDPGPGCQPTGPSLADQLESAGIPWKAYEENLPATCAQARSDAGEYAVRHDPFVYYPSVVANWCGNIVPATQLSADIAGGRLPAFSWITPNVCDDMHDSCSGSQIAQGDTYLRNVVPPLLAALGPSGAVFVVFDEGSSDSGGGLPGAAGGQVTMIAAGSAIKAGYRSSVAYDHYSLLRTIEDAWGLPPLGSAAGASPMSDIFSGS